MQDKKDFQDMESASIDAQELANNLIKISQKSQTMISDFYSKQKTDEFDPDPFNIGGAFLDLAKRMSEDPSKLINAQTALWQGYMDIWKNMAQSMGDQSSPPNAKKVKGDKRFRSEEWSKNQVFDYIKQTYLLTSNWVNETVADVDGLDDTARQKVSFFTKQFTDSLSPTNFF
ncbi:MAG: hypothetical protein JKY12_01435, partial [Sneathiella sp.]|nr:hypothetical protein [Sneathiella sp.]